MPRPIDFYVQPPQRPQGGEVIERTDLVVRTMAVPEMDISHRDGWCRAAFRIKYDKAKRWQRCRNRAHLDIFLDTEDQLPGATERVALCWMHAYTCANGNLRVVR